MAEVEHWDRVVALAKVSMSNPIAAAVLRLHSDRDGAGSCAECTGEYGVPWPCPTVLAIEQAAPPPTVAQHFYREMARRDKGATEPNVEPEEPTDGAA